MRLPLILLPASLAVVAACSEPHTALVTSGLRAAISDGANGGNPHFFFLPPMVANPGDGAGNDDTLSPTVVICQWDGGCVTTLATYTTDRNTTTTTHPGNSETVRVNRSHSIVNWHTGNFDLDPALTYRICVRVGDTELGFADVDVVASGGEQQDVADGLVAVVNGRTLPIKFRIEPDALAEPASAGCGTGPE